MIKKKHYLVYRITNLINGKIYVGKHQTDNINDGYLGSGIRIRHAMKKYGYENFKKEILFECSSKNEMDAKEAEIVNEDFLNRNDTYNLKIGGDGGFDFINSNGINNKANNFILGNKAWRKIMSDNPSIRVEIAKRSKESHRLHPEKYPRINPFAFKNKHHTKETKQKISEKNKRLVGNLNGSYGKVWIYNENLKQNKKVEKEQLKLFLNQDWKLGRKMNFYK